jgi:hypothetical protein
MGVYEDPFQVCPWDWQAYPFVGTHRDQDGRKTFSENIIQVIHSVVEPQVYPKVGDIMYLPLNDFRWKTIFRDP